ncbi:unnamed protein product [Gongylonema pulchrum]|uniref:Uncharacterized protein n=1 Tax=Gongylonema pulchrum TaxID=637853 RepID=A0A183DN57_9BILA|nr:unnamed protein product [Gongylonema pulchrum]
MHQCLRDSLLSRLENVVAAERHEVNERLATNGVPVGQYLTEIAAKLIWVRRKINKAENILIVCNELLGDLTAYPEVARKIQNEIDEMRSLESDLFGNWYIIFSRF